MGGEAFHRLGGVGDAVGTGGAGQVGGSLDGRGGAEEGHVQAVPGSHGRDLPVQVVGAQGAQHRRLGQGADHRENVKRP